MNRLFTLLAASFLAATLMISSSALAFQGSKDAAKTTTKTAATSAPSDKEIADAKAKGLVWVNTSSKIYHKDGQFYGKTKQGKFMTEDDAQKGGYRAAKSPVPGKKPSPR